jgi:hypothetical protein
MGFARARPEDLAQRALPDRLEGLEGLGGVNEVFEIGGKNARFLHGFKHGQGLGGRPAERLGAQDGLPGRGGAQDGLLMDVVREPDDDDLGFRVVNGLLQVIRGARDAVFGGESPGAIAAARIDVDDAVAAAEAV